MLKKILSNIYYRLPAFLGVSVAFPCRNVVFELEYSCNLNCEMCPYRKEVSLTRPSGTDLKPLDKDEVIRLLGRFPKGSNMTFTGGEPFLKEGILEILNAAAGSHNVTIATNGTLITEDIAGKMVRWGVKLIGLSLDGPENIHNDIRKDPQAFGKLVNAVELINEQKKKRGAEYPRVNFNGVILRKNFDSLYKNIELAKALGVNSHSFQIFDPSWSRSGWRLSDEINTGEKVIEQVETINREELKKALERLMHAAKELDISVNIMPPLTIEEIADYYDRRFDIGRWHCFFPWSTMRISPYGEVFPCLNFKIGNIRQQSPAELWNGPGYGRFRKGLKKATLFESCVGCCKMIREESA